MIRSLLCRSILSAALLVFGISQCAQAQTRMGIPAPQTDAPLANKPGKQIPLSLPEVAFGERNLSLSESRE